MGYKEQDDKHKNIFSMSLSGELEGYLAALPIKGMGTLFVLYRNAIKNT